MPQKLLYETKIGIAGEKMSGKRVAKSMRRDLFRYASFLTVLFDNLPAGLSRKALSITIIKQG
jgi:hypothetical protein